MFHDQSSYGINDRDLPECEIEAREPKIITCKNEHGEIVACKISETISEEQLKEDFPECEVDTMHSSK